MQIVDLEQFVELPVGTVYSIFYQDEVFPVEIKGVTIRAATGDVDNNWWFKQIFPDTDRKSHGDLIQSGESVKLKFDKGDYSRYWFYQNWNAPIFIIYDRGDIIDIANSLLASKGIASHSAQANFNILGEFKYVTSYVRLIASEDETEIVVEYNYPDGSPGRDVFKSLSHAKSFYETAVTQRLHGFSLSDVSIFMQQ